MVGGGGDNFLQGGRGLNSASVGGEGIILHMEGGA